MYNKWIAFVKYAFAQKNIADCLEKCKSYKCRYDCFFVIFPCDISEVKRYNYSKYKYKNIIDKI